MVIWWSHRILPAREQRGLNWLRPDPTRLTSLGGLTPVSSAALNVSDASWLLSTMELDTAISLLYLGLDVSFRPTWFGNSVCTIHAMDSGPCDVPHHSFIWQNLRSKPDYIPVQPNLLPYRFLSGCQNTSRVRSNLKTKYIAEYMCQSDTIGSRNQGIATLCKAGYEASPRSFWAHDDRD